MFTTPLESEGQARLFACIKILMEKCDRQSINTADWQFMENFIHQVHQDKSWLNSSDELPRQQQLASLTVELELAKQELAQRYEQLQSVYYWAATTDAISRAETIDEIYSASLSGLQEVLSADSAAIALFDTTGVLRFEAWQNLSSYCICAMTGYSPWNQEKSTFQPIIIPDITTATSDILPYQATILSEGIQALSWIPIVQQSQLIGYLGIYYNQIHELDDATVQLAQTITNHIVFAVERKHSEMELQKTQMQLIQSEKMSSLGQLVAGVAHEINNPVNFIFGNINYVSDYTQDLLQLVRLQQDNLYKVPEVKQFAAEIDLEFLMDDLPKLLNSMKVGAERIQQIVISLRSFSRIDEAEMKEVDIHEGINSTLMILEHRFKSQSERPQIEVIQNYGNLPLIECYAGQLNQVFMNIFTNAIDAIEESFISGVSSKINPQIRICTELAADKQVIIRITDNGKGIPENVQKKLFDPFFTTKDPGKGTGMGLAISYQIITQRHGGSLQCISSPGEGAEFAIIIPLRQGK